MPLASPLRVGCGAANRLNCTTMTEERVTPADQGLLAAYGRTMLSVQLFELSLLELVQINQPEPPESMEFDEAWKQVEPLFRMTAGQLKNKLRGQGAVPEELLEEIGTAVDTRNTLAHSYLLEYRVRRVSGAVTPGEAVQEMKQVRGLYRDLTARLDALTYRIAHQRGWDLDDLGGVTEEELLRALAEAEAGEENA